MRFTIEQSVDDPFALLCREAVLTIGREFGVLAEVRKVELADDGQVLLTYHLPDAELELLPSGRYRHM